MGIIFWLTLTFIFVILEIFIPALVSIWFAIAAGLTIILTFFINNLNFEIIFFCIISIFLIFSTKFYVKKFLFRNNENFDSTMVGSKVYIIKIISKDKKEKIYEVKFKGAIWTAISDTDFDENDFAFIKEFKGNKIII